MGSPQTNDKEFARSFLMGQLGRRNRNPSEKIGAGKSNFVFSAHKVQAEKIERKTSSSSSSSSGNERRASVVKKHPGQVHYGIEVQAPSPFDVASSRSSDYSVLQSSSTESLQDRYHQAVQMVRNDTSKPILSTKWQVGLKSNDNVSESLVQKGYSKVSPPTPVLTTPESPPPTVWNPPLPQSTYRPTSEFVKSESFGKQASSQQISFNKAPNQTGSNGYHTTNDHASLSVDGRTSSSEDDQVYHKVAVVVKQPIKLVISKTSGRRKVVIGDTTQDNSSAEHKAEEERLAAVKIAEEERIREEEERFAAEEEQLIAEKQAEEERLLKEKKSEEERILAKEQAQKERFLADKQAEEEQLLAEKRAEEERFLADKQAEEERILAKEQAQKERFLADKQAEEERLLAEKRAEEERLLADKQAEEERILEEKQTEEVKVNVDNVDVNAKSNKGRRKVIVGESDKSNQNIKIVPEHSKNKDDPKNELQRLKEVREKKKKEEQEKRKAEQEKRKAELEKKAAERKAEQEKKEEERKHKAEQKKVEEERKAAENKIQEEQLAAEKEADELKKAAEEKINAEKEQILVEEKAQKEKLAAEKKVEEEQQVKKRRKVIVEEKLEKESIDLVEEAPEMRTEEKNSSLSRHQFNEPVSNDDPKNELQRLKEVREKKKKEEQEKRKAEQEKRKAELEKKAAERKAEQEKKEEERKHKTEQKKVGDERKAAEEKIKEEQLAAEKEAEELRKAEEEKIKEDELAAERKADKEKILVEEKAQKEKLSAEKKVEDENKIYFENKSVDKSKAPKYEISKVKVLEARQAESVRKDKVKRNIELSRKTEGKFGASNDEKDLNEFERKKLERERRKKEEFEMKKAERDKKVEMAKTKGKENLSKLRKISKDNEKVNTEVEDSGDVISKKDHEIEHHQVPSFDQKSEDVEEDKLKVDSEPSPAVKRKIIGVKEKELQDYIASPTSSLQQRRKIVVEEDSHPEDSKKQDDPKNELQRLKEAREKKKKEEQEKRKAEQEKRKAELEKKAAERKAEQEKKEEERKHKAEQKKVEEERKAAEEKIQEEQLAAEKEAEELRKAEEEKIKAEKEQILVEEKAQKEKLAAEKKVEEEQKVKKRRKVIVEEKLEKESIDLVEEAPEIRTEEKNSSLSRHQSNEPVSKDDTKNELQRLKEAREKKKKEEQEKRKAEQEKRKAELEKKAAERKAEQEKKEEERKNKTEQKKVEDERKAAEKEAEELRKAEIEKFNAEKLAAEKKVSEQKKAELKKKEKERLLLEKKTDEEKLANEKRVEDERKAEKKKPEIEISAKEEENNSASLQRRRKIVAEKDSHSEDSKKQDDTKNELQRLKEAREKKKKEEQEKRKAEQEKRKAELEKKAAERKAEQEKKEEERKHKAEQKKAEDERKAAKKKIQEEQLAAEKEAEELRKAEEKKIKEDELAAEKKVSEQKKAELKKKEKERLLLEKKTDEEKLANEKRVEDERKAEKKKAEIEISAGEEKNLSGSLQRRSNIVAEKDSHLEDSKKQDDTKNELQRLKEAREKKKKEEQEKRKAEQEKRKAELEKKAAERKAEQEKKEEERKNKTEQKKVEEEIKAAEEKIQEEQLAAEKEAEELRKAEEEKIKEDELAAERKPEEESFLAHMKVKKENTLTEKLEEVSVSLEGKEELIREDEECQKIGKPTGKPSAPELIKPLEADISTHEGQPLKLTAKVTPEPDLAISWLKDGEPLKSDAHFKITSNKDGTQTLNIRSVKLEDSAEYSIQFTNDISDTITASKVFVDKKPKAPVFKKRLPATSHVVEGESITFNIAIDGQPKPTVQWQFQGKDITEDNSNVKIEEPEDDGKYAVTIQDCKMSDKGSFKCIAANKSGSVNCATSLTVKMGPPKVTVLSEEVANVDLGENAIFKVELPSDDAKYKVDWMKGTKPIFRSTKKYEIGSEDLIRSFMVVDAQETDKGVYKCNVSGTGGKTTKEFNLEIKEPEPQLPNIEEQSSEEIISNPGQSVTLECKSTGYPEPKAVWLKNEVEVAPSDGIKITSKNNVHSLAIKSITIDDDAEYFCQISNQHGSAEAIFSIIVEDEKTKPTFVEALEDLEIGEGDVADFSVLVESNPRSEVEWYLGDKLITNDGRFQITVEGEEDIVHTLVIEDCTEDDTSTVKCIATNEMGEESCTAKLKVVREEIVPKASSLPAKSNKADAGKPFELSMNIEDAMSVIWLFNGEEIEEGKASFEILQDGNKYTLRIPSMDVSFAGKYAVEAISPTGQVLKEEFEVKCKDIMPVVQSSSEKATTIEEGKPMVLSINVADVKSAKWLYNGKKVGRGVNTKQDRNTYTLSIDKMKKSDAGTYTFEATSPTGHVIKELFEVTYRDPNNQNLPRDLPKELKLALGDPLLLELCMDVDEPRDVIWEKDGEMLRNENEDCRADMGFDGACNYLRIQRTEFEDTGLYEVYGERGQNEVSFFTSVQVGDKITPPVTPEKRGVGFRSTRDLSVDEGVKTPPKVLRKPSASSREGSVDSGSLPSSRSVSFDHGEGSRVKSPPPPVFAKPSSRRISRESSKDIVSDDFIVPVEEKTSQKTPPAPAVKPKSRRGSRSSSFEDMTDSNELSSQEKQNELKNLNAPVNETALDQSKGIVDEKPILGIKEQNVSEASKDVMAELPKEEKADVKPKEQNTLVASKDIKNEANKVEKAGAELQKKAEPEIPKEEIEVDDGIPFLVKEKMKPFEATCDEKATVSVKFSKPAREFKWFFNNIEVSPDNENFVVEENCEGIYSLSFVQCSMRDDKITVKYVAKHSGKKELTDSIRMKVKPAKPELLMNTKIKDLYDLGEEIKLQLRVKGHKKPYSVNWAKGFRKVTEIDGKTEMKSDGDFISLILKNIETSDAGVYKCTVKCPAGTSEIKFSPIKVKVPVAETAAKNDQQEEVRKGLKRTGPSQLELSKMKLKKAAWKDAKKEDMFEVKEQLKSAVVESGDAAKFAVRLSKKAESFLWSFNEQDILDTSEEFTISCNDEEIRYLMSIKTCFLEQDKSRINFVAIYDGITLTNSVKLKVRPAAPGLKPIGEVKEVFCVGEEAVFALMINGHKEPFEITWFKGFKQVEGNNVEVETTATRTTLSLKNIDMSAAATYKCVIKSLIGTSEYKYSPIKIKEKFEYGRWEGSPHDDLKLKHGRSSSKTDSKTDSPTKSNPKPALSTEEEIAANEEARLLEMYRRASFDSWASGDEDDPLIRFRRKKRADAESSLRVVEKLKAKVVEEDDEAFFKVVLSETVDSFTWFINKVEVASIERLTTVSEGILHMLIMRDCTLGDDRSSIRFLALLNDEEVFGAARLKVKPASPKLKLKTKTLEEYLTGDEIPFELLIRGHPEPFEIKWSKGFRGVSHEEGRTEINIQRKEVSLLVKEAELSDAGIYKCVIKSAAGTSEYKYDGIKIKENPDRIKREDPEPFEVTEKMKPVVVECGDAAEFTVSFSKTPDHVEWYIEDVKIDPAASETYTVKTDEENNKSFLTILRCTMTENNKSIKYIVTRKGRDLTSSIRLKVQPAMPGLKQLVPLKETYQEEEEIKFAVEIKGHSEQYTVQWYKGFKVFNIDEESYGFVRDNNNHLFFIIKNCQKSDAGSYKVVVKSSVTTSELKFDTFKVKEKIAEERVPTAKPVNFQDQEIREGSVLELTAEVDGFPSPIVEWHKGSTLIKSTKGVFLSNDKTLYKLKIAKASLGDTGNYKIIATNKLDSASFSAHVAVKPKPAFIKGLEDQDVYDDTPAVFEVEVDHADTVSWFLDNEPVSDDEEFEFQQSGSLYSYTIKQVHPADSGKYECRAVNKFGTVTTSCRLKVLEKNGPMINIDLPEEVECQKGGEFELKFDVEGDPSPEVFIYKDEKSIDRNEKRNCRPVVTRMGRTYLFFLADLKESDSGTYVIEAENSSGLVEKEFQMKVTASKKDLPTVNVDLPESGVVKGKEGGDFELNFDVPEDAELSFFKNGKELDMGRAVATRMGRSYLFFMGDLRNSDSGKYTVEVENEGGKITKEFEIDVIAKPKDLPNIKVKLPRNGIIDVKEGESFELNFDLSNEDCEAVFFKGDEQIKDDMGRAVITRTGRRFRFYIPKVQESDSGSYMMEVKADSGVVSKQFRINVAGQPKKPPVPTIDVNLPEEPIKKKEGDSFECRFKISAHPEPEVFFFKDEKPIDEKSASVKIKHEGDYYSFSITNLTVTESGLYVVEAENENGLTEKEFQIEVIAKPKIAPTAPSKCGLRSVVDISRNNDKPKPVFTTKLQDKEVISMSAVKFEVVFQGDPEPEITWFKNDAIIDDDDRNFRQEEEDDGTATLVIMEVSTAHRGTYKCLAKNKHGKATTSAELFVEDHGFESGESESELGGRSLPRTEDDDLSDDLLDEEDELDRAQIILPLRDRKATLGSSAKFSCRAQSINTSSIPVEWYHNDQPVDLARMKSAVTEEGELFTLHLENVQLSDAGRYKIMFKLPNETLSSSAELDVEDEKKTEYGVETAKTEPKKSPKPVPPKPTKKPGQEEPKFVLQPKDKTVVEGNQLKLTASVLGKPPPSIEWYKGDDLVTSSPRIDIHSTNNLCSMTIKSTTIEDAATYRCTARNDAGSCTVESIVNIEPSKTKSKVSLNHPAFTTQLESDYAVDEGKEIELKVEFSGKPQPKVVWEKDSHRLVSIKRVKINYEEGVSCLVIKALREGDLGNYTCTIANFHGSSSCSTNLRLASEETPGIQIQAPNLSEPTISTADNKSKFTKLDDNDATDDEVAGLTDRGKVVNTSSEYSMNLLQIKELHPGLNREVTRHKFPGATGIDVVVMPATPRDSPISGARPVIKEKPQDMDLEIGETALFELILADHQGVNVSWSKNGQILFGSGKTRIWSKENSFFLEIKKVEVEDEDLYECRIRNDYGEVMCDVQLLVNEEEEDEEEEPELTKARFTKKLQKQYQLFEGDKLTLEVHTEGTSCKVAWYYEGKKLLGGDFMLIMSDGDVHKLIIPETVLDDEGVYSCVASNELGKDETEADVFVDEVDDQADGGATATDTKVSNKMPEIIRSLSDKEAFEEDEIRFDVEIIACETVQWFLNDKQIKPSDQFQIMSKDDRYSFIINSVEIEHDGQVKVKASSAAGSVEATCELLVEEDKEKDVDKTEKQPEERTQGSEESEDEELFTQSSVAKKQEPQEEKQEFQKVEVEDTRRLKIEADFEEGDIIEQEPPELTETFQNQEVEQGSSCCLNVRLNSKVPSSNNNIVVKWLCGDDIITSSRFSHMTVVSDNDLHSLVINDIRLLDTAQYTCVVSNDAGECQCSADILVMPAGLNGESGTNGQPLTRKYSLIPLTKYIVTEDYHPKSEDCIPLNKDDAVEILDKSKPDIWLVRKLDSTECIGFVESRVLRAFNDNNVRNDEMKVTDVMSSIADEETFPKEVQSIEPKGKEHPEESTEQNVPVESEKKQQFIAIGNYDPKSEEELELTEGVIVELVEGLPNQEYWVVRVLNKNGETGPEGLVPSTFLELKGEVKDEDTEKHKCLEHREKVVMEVLKTEQTYIEQLDAAIQLQRIEANKNESPMRGKNHLVFANLRDIHQFHSVKFMAALEAAHGKGADIAQVFVDNSDELEAMYVYYCNSRPTADEILDKQEIIEYWDEIQQSMDIGHSLRAYLITPVQRITRYQLLLKEILKYTTRADRDSTCIQNALSKISYIIRHANDTMHIKRIAGYENELPLSQAGDLLKMDTVLTWDNIKAKGKGKERHLFLLEKVLIGAKKTEGGGKNKDDFSYNVKFVMKISDVGQTEFVENFPTRWVLWTGRSAASATVQYTLEAKSELDKDCWVREIREMLARQLADLKNTQGKSYEKPPQNVSPDVDKYGPTEQMFPAITERISGNEAAAVSKIVDDLTCIEEQYIAAEYPFQTLSPGRKEQLVTGQVYRLNANAKTKENLSTLFKAGDLVSLIRAGTTLYLVEPAGCDDPFKRTWVPGSYLVPLTETFDEDEEEENQDPPVFIKHLESMSVKVGGNVKFECQILNSLIVEWFYDDMQITVAEGTEMLYDRDSGTTSLTIENICPEDSGDYTVRAINDAGISSNSARLTVEAPPLILTDIQSLTLTQYDNATFRCSFQDTARYDGNATTPARAVRWYCDGKEIHDAGKFIIETKATVSILDIAEVDLDDAGEYKFVVSNEFGESESVATLFVNGGPDDELQVPAPPGQPSSTKVTDHSVSLSWPVSPSSDVTHYKVELRNIEDGPDAWKLAVDSVESNSCTVTELKHEDEIVFRVKAFNEHVASEPSPVSDKILIEAPRKKKSKKKGGVGTDDSNNSKSPEPNSGGRVLSPFQKRRAMKNMADSSSSSTDDDEDTEQLGGRGRLSPRTGSGGSHTFPGASRSKGLRSRSKSPMRAKQQMVAAMNSSQSPDGKGAPYFTRELDNSFVGEGGAAKFICRCQGNPEPEITWFKEKEKLAESKQFTILTDADGNHILIIIQNNHDTAGSYACVASNLFGTSKSTAMLFVEGLQTEYDSETEDEVSDPEPQPEREEITVRKEGVNNHYFLKEELGRGKFGVVTKCQDKITNIEYAAKFIKCRPTDRKNVLNEIDIMNSLNHKRLINLVAAFEASRQIVLVLELVTGGELFEKLTEEEYISEKDVTFYMKQVLQGMQHMHEREILHLDLKPENIMLVNPHSTQIKLIDFGLARRYKKGDSLKVLFGTPEFMGPEVINYDQVTTATDMWSIGVITYVLLSGLSPFAGDNDSETLTNVTSGEWDFDDPVFEDISDEAKDFITELLVMRPSERATVKYCLEHPWFMFKKFKKKIRTDRLKAFTARRKWKKTITAVRSTNFLTRLLTGIKTAQTNTTALSTPTTPTTPVMDHGLDDMVVPGSPASTSSGAPAWKRVEDVEESEAPEFENRLADLKIRRGEVAHFQATFTNNVDDEQDMPEVAWKREGRLLNESKHTHMTVIGNVLHLKILNSQIDDTGRYTLRLENQHGAVECSAHLIVRDAPSPPAAPAISQVLSTTALVQWRAPFDGNSPIISYRLQYRKLNDQEWSVFSDSIVQTITVVEDLEPSSSYRFRVSATNEIGASDMGEQTDLVKTLAEDESSKRESIDAPGARRLSRSLSITVPPGRIRSRTLGYEIKLKETNPENNYNFKEEIGRGKFAVVKKVGSKHSGETYAAKLVKYDEDTVEVTKKEFEIWKDLDHPNLVLLHNAFFVRKYLILVCDMVSGQDILMYMANLPAPTEDDLAGAIKQLLEALDYLHQMNICHLDVKPSNILMIGSMVKLIDYGSARRISGKGGEVGEMVGTTEFMSPEMISFDAVSSFTDMWSVGILVYSLLSGLLPFTSDDEDETMGLITAVDYRFDPNLFDEISEEAKTFISSLIVRIPEKRPAATVCLEDPWLSDAFEKQRLASGLAPDALMELWDFLEEQEEMETVRASLVMRTFLQSPYESPDESESEEDEA